MQETQGISSNALSGSRLNAKAKKNQKPEGIFSSIFSRKMPAQVEKPVAPVVQEKPEQVKQKKNTEVVKAAEHAEPNSDLKKKSVRQKPEKEVPSSELTPQVPLLEARKEKKDQPELRDKNEMLSVMEKKAASPAKESAQQWTIIDQRKNKEKIDKTEQSGGKSQTESNKVKARPEPELIIRADNDNKNVSGTIDTAQRQEPQRFAEVLARHLEDSSHEIVKTAQIVLNDGDTGTIRLKLEPEALGNVKIELKLAEKKISGTIVVESDLVQAAFKDSYAALRDAFNSQGFELTQLDIDVRNGNGSQNGQAEKQPFFAEGLRLIDRSVPDAEAPNLWGVTSGTSVNLVI